MSITVPLETEQKRETETKLKQKNMRQRISARSSYNSITTKTKQVGRKKKLGTSLRNKSFGLFFFNS